MKDVSFRSGLKVRISTILELYLVVSKYAFAKFKFFLFAR